MMIRRLLPGLTCAGALAAQTLIQMSDPQFGMFTKNASSEHETVNVEFAIASANRPRRPGGTVRTAVALVKTQAELRRTVAVVGRSEVVHLTGSHLRFPVR